MAKTAKSRIPARPPTTAGIITFDGSGVTTSVVGVTTSVVGVTTSVVGCVGVGGVTVMKCKNIMLSTSSKLQENSYYGSFLLLRKAIISWFTSGNYLTPLVQLFTAKA